MLRQLGIKKIDIGLTDRHRELVRSWSTGFTPDILKLEKYRHQLLFVCDELMSDRRNGFLLEGKVTERVTGFTADRFDFLISPDGISLPVPRQDGWIIKGEILAIPDKTVFRTLDTLKQRGVQFVRRRVPILDPYRPWGHVNNGADSRGYYTEDGIELPEALQGLKLWVGDEEVAIQHAWMYMANIDYWDYNFKRRPESFDRVPRFEPKKEKKWLSEYFRFQNPPDE